MNWGNMLGKIWADDKEQIRLINFCGDYVEILYLSGFNQGLRTTAFLDKWEAFCQTAKLIEEC